MNRQFFTIYQYLSPLILTPLSFWLWWKTYEENLTLTLNAWLLPILFAYIVPGVGTNILKVWEFNTRFRLGKFRPHHGFVFGSATSMIVWLTHTHSAMGIFDVIQSAFIVASVLGFWNLIYDIKALKAGILLVYNQPWGDKKGEEAIAMDYAPIFFAGFGAVYGANISIAELLNSSELLTGLVSYIYFMVSLVIAIGVPVWLYRYFSFKKHGHSGCKPITRK
jgi:hypothetical protein